MQAAVEAEGGANSTSIAALKSALEMASGACAAYVRHAATSPPLGTTKLDKERLKLCLYEIVSLVFIRKLTEVHFLIRGRKGPRNSYLLCNT